MDRRVAALLVVVIGGIVWALAGWWSGGDAVSPSPTIDAPSAPSVAAGVQPAAAAVAVARDEAATAPGLPSLPEVPVDAMAVEVMVVDHATDVPVAGIEVTWSDERSRALVATLSAAQQQQAAAQGGLVFRGRTDARGIVAVHLLQHTAVQARDEGRSGVLDCSRDAIPPGGFRLRLHATHTLTVRVIDSDGRPAAGVAVALLRELRQNSIGSGLSATTDAAGLCTFSMRYRQLEAMGKVRTADGLRETDLSWVACANIVAVTAPRVQFDPTRAVAQQVELQLPPCGKVRVRLDSAGVVVPASVTLQAVAAPPDPTRPSVQRDLDGTGEALFPWVAIDGELELSVSVARASVPRQRLQPLRRRGEERSVVMPFASQQPVYVVRIVDEQQQPLRNVPIRIGLHGVLQPARTDADGYWRDFAELPTTGSRVPDLVVSVPEVGRPPRFGALRQLTFAPGHNRLGDLVAAPLPRLAAGQFLVGGRPASASCWLQVERQVAGAIDAADGGWQTFTPCEVDCWSVPGRFTVHGLTELIRHRLVFADPAFRPRPPVEFVPGAEELSIELEPAHALVVALRGDLPHGDGLLFSLLPQQVRAAPGDDSLQPRLDWSFGGHGAATWRGLPPGSYALELRLRGFAERLLRVDDVQVPPPFPPDPRLALDLRNLVEAMTVQVVVAGGERETGYGSDLLVVMPPAANPAPAYRPWADEFVLTVPARPIELLIAYAGCEPLRVPGARGKVQATVVPYAQVEVRLADGMQVPVGFSLRLRLQGGGEGLAYELDGEPGRIELGDPSLPAVEMQRGRAVLPVGPRPQRLLVELVRDEDGESAPLQRCEPAVVQAGVASVALRLDADEVRAAIAAMR